MLLKWHWIVRKTVCGGASWDHACSVQHDLGMTWLKLNRGKYQYKPSNCRLLECGMGCIYAISYSCIAKTKSFSNDCCSSEKKKRKGKTVIAHEISLLERNALCTAFLQTRRRWALISPELQLLISLRSQCASTGCILSHLASSAFCCYHYFQEEKEARHNGDMKLFYGSRRSKQQHKIPLSQFNKLKRKIFSAVPFI